MPAVDSVRLSHPPDVLEHPAVGSFPDRPALAKIKRKGMLLQAQAPEFYAQIGDADAATKPGSTQLQQVLNKHRLELEISGAQLRLEQLGALWQVIAFKALDKVLEGLKANEPPKTHLFQVYANIAGIATEKTLLVAGRPTAITAELHANIDLGALAEKLAGAARALAVKPLEP